jgi:CHASE1-domain containing sensor protein
MKRKTRNWIPVVTDLVSLLTALAALGAAIWSR